ncbi:MAG: MFS transporter [Acidobacteria bacterium]|nr:MAG: MFS transporter [Acidobacteriota bacterium]
MAAGVGRDVKGRYRWWIGTLLLLSTVVNYIDRQTLSVLGPRLKVEFHWTNESFALVIISFRIAYTVMQAVTGRLLDRVGTRRGLSLAVLWYSAAAMLTSLATGLRSFCALRFLLGAGEAANWPGATKAVAEWFPRRERGWAVALFDSGSSFGAAIAVVLVPLLYTRLGGCRPAFLVTGTLGLLWLLLWRRSYHPPEAHPRLGSDELRMILDDRAAERAASAPGAAARPSPGWGTLLALPQTWGVIAARGLSDPVWFMITDWFAIYLASKGFKLEDTATGFWVPFLAADLGNFFGGGWSSFLIRRGWSVGRARKALIVGGAFGVLMLIPAAYLSTFVPLVACFAVATFSYAALSTMALALPADLFESGAVASVAGMAGAAAGAGTIVSTFLIGIVADRFSFKPILVTASLVPLLAAGLVLLLVRNDARSGQGVVKVI